MMEEWNHRCVDCDKREHGLLFVGQTKAIKCFMFVCDVAVKRLKLTT